MNKKISFLVEWNKHDCWINREIKNIFHKEYFRLIYYKKNYTVKSLYVGVYAWLNVDETMQDFFHAKLHILWRM